MAEPARGLVAYSDGVMDDIKMLPNRALQELAVRLIRDLVLGNVRGLELGVGPVSSVPLPGLRRVYFDTPDERRMGRVAWRIVYRELEPDGIRPHRRIHIIAIGSRIGLQVYDIARQRLAAAQGGEWSPRQRSAPARSEPAAPKPKTRYARDQIEGHQQHHQQGQQPGPQGPAPQP